MHIKEQWNRLDPTTQQWLMDNPGAMVLPRTLTAIFNNETGENADADVHGETVLTEEDRSFIQATAREATAAGTPADFRFFDATQP
jgi:antitoxin component of MazEF toxin-antitoxin module